MNEFKIECNDPLKEVKTIYGAIKTTHQISVEAKIKSWWLNDLYLKHPGIQDQVVTDMFMRLGLAIQEAAKERDSLATLETNRFADNLVLSLSTIVIRQKELFNYLQMLYEDGYKTGFENGQIFSKHLNKEKHNASKM